MPRSAADSSALSRIKNLNEMLAAWKELVEAKHTKNAVTVTRGRD
jgi:hypothetical protein